MTQNKQVFVLIRGLLRETRHWGNFLDVLKKKFPNALILTPEVPGNGKLNQQTSPHSISGMTAAIREQIAHHRHLNLIAISMGGMIAIDWMVQFPEEIDSAVLINASVRPLSPFYQRLRWQVYPALINMLFHSKISQEQYILYLTSNQHRDNTKLLESWQQWQQQNPVSAVSVRNQLYAAFRFSVKSKPQQPVLIVTSSADRLVDCRCSLSLQRHWQKDFRMHQSAGHDLPLDDPEWLATLIRQWFDAR